MKDCCCHSYRFFVFFFLFTVDFVSKNQQKCLLPVFAYNEKKKAFSAEKKNIICIHVIHTKYFLLQYGS